MFSIVDTQKNEIARKNIVSRKDLVWPDGFVSFGYADVGEVHQVTRTLKDGGEKIVERWQLYEDDIQNGEAGRKLRLGPPEYDAASNRVIRHLIPCDERASDELELTPTDARGVGGNSNQFSEESFDKIVKIIVQELALRGNPATLRFKDLTTKLTERKSANN